MQGISSFHYRQKKCHLKSDSNYCFICLLNLSKQHLLNTASLRILLQVSENRQMTARGKPQMTWKYWGSELSAHVQDGSWWATAEQAQVRVGSIEKVPGRCGSGVSTPFTAQGSLHLSYRPGTMKSPTGPGLLALLLLAASLPSEISSKSRPCLSASLFHHLNLIWSSCYQRFRKKWILNSIREKTEE